ncbi:hypothetical protein BCT46_15700 [Vibrio sp. 10N.261.46.E8]|nr:hypothetical protein BH584_05520 [Vibrio sp. 10N.261.45.E1]PMJ34412.1 hypothetical protein BCU27_03015 [Vibrio sp. 10N.286.45.B6]PML86783.1 hypothetical protein BCT66_00720 [Vibrio sp. 10N.261.49.E11]PMM76783.1 hypothetical protein BCT48_24595 [Vibrio sp. 10N.261.46.F12]PMM81849.1 hypothetical protein BCT46_15700 [Vibrio sp. 10N.261.46.E8]PMN80477.1 hypothetical protein BCT25_15565 [Vibrio sp. 10N.261.45.A6]PMN83701.1 hypothetical protein BCT22_11855 [Vibrio sp. 10N.261.45.A1]
MTNRFGLAFRPRSSVPFKIALLFAAMFGFIDYAYSTLIGPSPSTSRFFIAAMLGGFISSHIDLRQSSNKAVTIYFFVLTSTLFFALQLVEHLLGAE